MSLMELFISYRWLAEYMTVIATFGVVFLGLYKCAVFVVEHKRLVVEHEEAKRAYEEEKAKNNAYKDRLDAVIEELDGARRIEINHGFIFLASDSAPRFPLCPICHADTKVIRMRFLLNDEKRLFFHCPKCQCQIPVTTDEIEWINKQGHKQAAMAAMFFFDEI